MNLKIGQIIKHRPTEYNRMVLEVFTNTALLSNLDNFEQGSLIVTFKEIQENYILPEEEWEPEINKPFYFINVLGDVDSTKWMDESFDNRVKNFLGIYRTKEDAEKALKDIKNKLGK